MLKKNVLVFFASLLAASLMQCGKPADTIKSHPDDPFAKTIVHSQSYEIDAKQDNVVEGEKGTLLVFPKGCFKNPAGETVDGNVKIELAEGFALEDMILSNLTATSGGKLLVTDGMIYFNATSNGEQLTIDKENPIRIEIPTAQKQPGMMAYKGTRDEKGNMDWTDPKELDDYLIAVDINGLQFLPPGFQAEVNKAMPYKQYKSAMLGLADSLYYGLTDAAAINMMYMQAYDMRFVHQENEPSKTAEKGNDESISFGEGRPDSVSTQTSYGIDPAIIKAIKSEKFQNTLIATREFEARLKTIFQSCENPILENYIKNLDKNLYELDSIAATMTKKERVRSAFLNFARQRMKKVKGADKYAALLKGFYEKRLAKVKEEMQKNSEKWAAGFGKENEEAKKNAEDFKKLLGQREKHRMQTYGFTWTETGWINIDNGTMEKDWGNFPLEIALNNGKEFDRVYTYIVYASIKSLYRLNTDDNVQFYAGKPAEKAMPMPKSSIAYAIAIGYKGETPWLAVREFKTSKEPKFSMGLSLSSIDKVKEAIKPFQGYGKENDIEADMSFMAKAEKEKQRQKDIWAELELIQKLKGVAYPCWRE